MTRQLISISDFILSLVLLSLCLLLSLGHHLDWLSTSLSFIFTPLRRPLISLSTSANRQFISLHDIPMQKRLIDDLHRQNSQLALLANTATQLESENQMLRQSLNSPLTKGHHPLPVRIVALSRYALIDKGSADHITSGLPLVVDGSLLGVIDSVSAHSSSVKLLTDPSLSLSAHTLSGLNGQVTFTQNTLTINQLPSQNALSPDQPIFTIATDPVPEGILIGKIKTVKADVSSVYQSATITPSVIPSIQQTALVILP